MKEQYNLSLNGSGNSSGGTYKNVKIRGEGTILDDIDCDAFKTYGASEVQGNVKAHMVTVFGETKIRGDLHSENVKVNGNLEVSGPAEVKRTKVRGMFDIGENFTGEEIDITGGINVKGNLEAEDFTLNGGFTITDMLNAGNINIILRYEHSNVKEIGGEKITVQKKSSFFPFSKHGGYLHANIIEGDEIYLEYTKADVVRGNNVTIGPECEIGVVEYHESYKNADQSIVKEYKQI
ncbi:MULTISPECIES: cytoplasmic protein [unclassified Bacillus (in: firmicutes)]|uniref:cytoplasmic protein n=1 Tax=unclassified Bacillus (in: firmicutes) TaxID=185979 RepID=UPI0008ED24A6|nr:MULTISPECIES: cytoplasmic protein [unclassified Bacillus (in: firmicutes)]SFI78226.1 protein CcmA, bactofilin family [Bacillus sp. 71mf]SFS86358.1 protein CcmA, bactofilin family [Bacillus sp. 103mf]